MNLVSLESLEYTDYDDINNLIFMICDFCLISTERVTNVNHQTMTHAYHILDVGPWSKCECANLSVVWKVCYVDGAHSCQEGGEIPIHGPVVRH